MSNNPRPARSSIRGSLQENPESNEETEMDGRLKLLGIAHRKAVAIERIGLCGGDDVADCGGAKNIGSLKFLHKRDDLFGGVRGHLHVQEDFVAWVDQGTDGKNAHVIREHLLEVGEDPGPTGCLQLDEIVEQDTAVENDLIAGEAHLGVNLRLLSAYNGKLPVDTIENDLGLPGLFPRANGLSDQSTQ